MSRIPSHFHFLFGLRLQTEPFHLVYYLCLESCLRVNRPERITLYYHFEPYGRYWDLIQSRIELVRVPLCPEVTDAHYDCDEIGKKLRYAHHADFIRLEKLIEHGGVYADIDTLFLQPLPDRLFEHAFVLGREDRVRSPDTGEWSNSLCNALMLSEPGSAFARRWRERMPMEHDGSWSNHSCQLAARLAAEMPNAVMIEPSDVFYPFMWTPEGIRGLLEDIQPWPEGAVSVHLWAHLWWERRRRDFSSFYGDLLTEDYIRNVDTSYNLAARPFLPSPARGLGASAMRAWRRLITPRQPRSRTRRRSLESPSILPMALSSYTGPISDYLNPRFLAEIDLPSVDTILEFGAHDGKDTIALRERFGAHIHAFECHPEFFTVARERCRPHPEIHMIEKAVWDADARIPFYPVIRTTMNGREISNPGASSCFRSRNDYRQLYEQTATEVEAIRVEGYCAEHHLDRIDLLCMDVQGAALHALRGLGDRLRDVRYVIAEIEDRPLYEGQHLYPEISAYLKAHGFVRRVRVRRDDWFSDYLFENHPSWLAPLSPRQRVRRRAARTSRRLARLFRRLVGWPRRKISSHPILRGRKT